MRIALFCLGIVLAAGFCAPGMAQTDRDYLAPSSPEPGLVSGLRGVTLISSDIEAVRQLYADAFGLTEEGPIDLADDVRRSFSALWGIDVSLPWRLHQFRRPSVPGAAVLRVLEVPEEVPVMRVSWQRREPGPYGIGFATEDTFALDERALAAGFERTLPQVSDYTTQRPDGSLYRIHEASWYGPEFIRAIGVSRKDDMPPIGPIDPNTGMGGPSYASQILVQMQPMLDFFVQVLDFEVRSRRDWTQFDPPFRFVMAHPKGDVPGQVAFVEYDPEHLLPPSGVAARPPHRGMAIWSFETSSLDEVRSRAREHGVDPDYGPIEVNSPAFGPVRVMTLTAPNGFLIEIFELQ